LNEIEGVAKPSAMKATFLAFPLLLAACTGPIETRVDSAGLANVSPGAFEVDADSSNLSENADTLVINALAQKGFRASSTASLSLQISVSNRPAAVAIQSGSATLSKAASKQRCADREYRLGITLTRISDGAEVYRATAAEFHCKLTLAQVLPVLVKSALADLGAPKGSYALTRPRPGQFRLIPAGLE
jgi:hypothetical protein